MGKICLKQQKILNIPLSGTSNALSRRLGINLMLCFKVGTLGQGSQTRGPLDAFLRHTKR
jgi:hypothetical protein